MHINKFYTILKSLRYTLVLLFQIAISIILTGLFGPFLFLSWVLNELVRQLVSFILFIRFGKKYHLVPDGADNVWHYYKEGNNRMCVILLFSDAVMGKEDLETIRALFHSKVVYKTVGGPSGKMPYAKLKKTFTRKLGYDCFREDGDEAFEIRNHVHFYKDPERGEHDPCERVFQEEEFFEEVLPKLASDMSEDKPQWEYVLVPKVVRKTGGLPQSVRCLRYHHGYMDGMTANMLFANCMYADPPDTFPFVINPLKPLRIPRIKVLLIKLLCFLTAGFTMVKILYTASTLFKGRFVTKKFSGKRHFGWSAQIEASLIRGLKARTKACVPTILATCTAEALRKMMEAFPKGTRPSQGEEKEVVLGMINALLPYKGIEPQNKFTLTHFPLPLRGGISWAKRLLEIEENMIKIPSDPAFYLTRFMFRFFGRFPCKVIQKLLEDAGNPISFSNLPMTNQEVTIWGHKVHDVAGFAPLVTNTGMGIIIIRYAHHIRFLTVADEACLSKEEVDFFLQEVSNQIRIMAQECSKSSFDISHANANLKNVLPNV